MTSAALGIGYSLWLRLRWVAIGIFVTILALAATAKLFPISAPYCAAGSIVVLALATVFLLNAFTYGPTNLGVRSSGFPTHMRTLPVSTRALVGWPMLFAAITLATFWALPICLIFLPAGYLMPMFWPAAMLVALCVWVQATSWMPFPSPFARVPALVVAIAPLLLPLAFGITFIKGTTLSTLLFASSLAWSFVAYLVGVRGLSRARSGSEADWFQKFIKRWNIRARQRYAASFRRRPFRSAFAAQLWHECRRNAVVFPIMLGFIGPVVLLLVCLPVLNPNARETFIVGHFAASPQMLGLVAWAFFPWVLAISISGGMAKFDIWDKVAMTAFFATRPMTTVQFIWIKCCASALSAIAAWIITIGLFLVWALLEASPLNAHPSIIRAAMANATPRSVMISFFVLLGLVVWTWREIASGLWPTLSGRKHFANAVGFAFMIAMMLAGGIGTWIYKHPAFHDLFWQLLPWMVGSSIGLKVLAAAWLSIALIRRELISRYTLIVLAFAWLLLAGLLIASLSLILSPTWSLVAGVIMALPFPSFAAAPLALDWNRHR
jgi:hypothetical protein